MLFSGPGCICAFLASFIGVSLAEQIMEKPTLEISLAPSQFLSPISAAIGDMEASREKFEEEQMHDIVRAANEALQSVSWQIHIITDRILRSMKDPALGGGLSTRLKKHQNAESIHPTPVAFLDTRVGSQGKDTFMVRVHEAAAPAADSITAQIAQIRALEGERTQEESRTFRRAAAEMNELVNLFSAEFQAQVDKQITALLVSRPSLSFLQASEAGVRVVPSDMASPTIESLASDMQRRRDIAENLVRARLTMEKLNLLQAANALAKEKLEAIAAMVRRVRK